MLAVSIPVNQFEIIGPILQTRDNCNQGNHNLFCHFASLAYGSPFYVHNVCKDSP